MQRREFLRQSVAFGAAAPLLKTVFGPGEVEGSPGTRASRAMVVRAIKPPPQGKINVAFVLTENANVMDFAGPWEVFQDVHIEGRGLSMEDMMRFALYTVSDKTEMIHATSGLKIIPDFTFENAPPPRVVVVPAQAGRSQVMLSWLRKTSKNSDVLMSVCTGAFVLGAAGVLSGKNATTHHDYQDEFAKRFPDVKLQRNVRFVENEVVSTAGGLTSGIDLALHVVERYFGRKVAEQTAAYMEYQSRGWMT